MDPNRKRWNAQHKRLRQAFSEPEGHHDPIDLFLRQHAMVHDSGMSNSGFHSFADEVWEGASETVIRCLPPKFEHSIAWLIWHIARIEDMTMNGLLAGREQVFFRDEWQSKLGISVRHSGNVVMDDVDVTGLSLAIDIEALRAYRQTVGRATRGVVKALSPGAFNQKVDPARLQGLLENGSVTPEATGLLDYWGSLTLAGLLLMPPTRHCFVHLNEALRVKEKCL